MWSAFRASLNKDLKTSHSLSQPVKFQAAQQTRIRITPILAFPSRASNAQPLARPHQLQALAAADACAEDDLVGIGGWAITS